MPELDDFQEKFCKYPFSNQRLLAPAGSGKTLSLLWRCKYLYEMNNELKFLILTFTRGAKDELLDRLKYQSEFKDVRSHIRITTLNSWGWRQIKSEIQDLKLLSSPDDMFYCMNYLLRPVWLEYDFLKKLLKNQKYHTRDLMYICDEFKSLGFRHDLYNRFESFEKHIEWLRKNGLNSHFSKLINSLIKIGFRNVINSPNDFKNDPIKQISKDIYERFYLFWIKACEHMWRSAIVTLEDQKYWSLIKWEKLYSNSTISSNDRYNYIMVDEFQDINPLDLNLLKVIVKANDSKVVVVGDDDQAIYEWRGATPNFILNPEKHFNNDFETFILEINYRTPANIIKMSQDLISHNQRRVPKRVYPNINSDAEVIYKIFPTMNETINYVKQIVQECFTNDEEKKTIGIIGRKRSQIIPYQIIFASDEIPFYAAEDLNIFLGKAFESLKEMLKIVYCAKQNIQQSSMDNVNAFLKLCDKVRKYPLNKQERSRLYFYLIKNSHRTIFEVLSSFQQYQGYLRGRNDAGNRYEFCIAIGKLLEARNVADAINIISEDFEGLQKDYGRALEDIFYIDPPFLFLSDYDQRYGSDYIGFIEHVEKAIANLPAFTSYDDSEGNYQQTIDENFKTPLHLMTALRAKGKEFDTVIVLDVNDDIWPSKLAKETQEELEQERRLFYVVITRVRKRLFLLTNERILNINAFPSPYLSEMGL